MEPLVSEIAKVERVVADSRDRRPIPVVLKPAVPGPANTSTERPKFMRPTAKATFARKPEKTKRKEEAKEEQKPTSEAASSATKRTHEVRQVPKRAKVKEEIDAPTEPTGEASSASVSTYAGNMADSTFDERRTSKSYRQHVEGL